MSKQQINVDIIIAGGGVVGCTAALAIANRFPYKIAVIEAFDTQSSATVSSNSQHPSFDARVVALAKQSVVQLESFGIELSDIDMCPINQIHVSDKGHVGQVRLNADEQQPMGQVIALEHLGAILQKQLEQHPQISLFKPDKIVTLTRSQLCVDVQTQHSQINAKLLLVAEGANSKTKALAGINNQVSSYSQSAIIANVETQLPHQNCAFERFTSQGPIALLPMNKQHGNRMSLVWTTNDESVDEIMALSEAEFLVKLRQLFSDKLGRFTQTSLPKSYPLQLVVADNFASHRVICVGNTAQSLHPIAGQGFNLGIRDIFDLCRSIDEHEGDLADIQHILSYKQIRNADKHTVISATDSLVRLFSNQHSPFVVARNLGLLGLNINESLKARFTKFAMGER